MGDLQKFLEKMERRALLLKDAAFAFGGSASTTLATQKRRIFAEGKKPDGSGIGRYSPQYLEERARVYKREGSEVILTATAQMRNDYTVIFGSDFVGLGFNNPFNAGKAEKNEKRYNSAIFNLSDEERSLFLRLVEQRLAQALQGLAK